MTQRGDNANEMGDNLPAINLGTGRTATAIAAGDADTCALLDDGTVKCWGDNSAGQLGQENTTDIGWTAGQMGDNLFPIDLGTGRTATAISVKRAFVCALLDNATVKCWGYNFDGELGQGDTTPRGDSALAGHQMGDNLPAINLGTGRTATAIAAGDHHACALLDDATVKCWGYNNVGSLGQGDFVARGDNAGEMGDNLPAIDLGTGRTATAIDAGEGDTCALLDDATAKCWGYNNNGQLGQGDTNNRGDNAGEMGDNLPALVLDGPLFAAPRTRRGRAGVTRLVPVPDRRARAAVNQSAPSGSSALTAVSAADHRHSRDRGCPERVRHRLHGRQRLLAHGDRHVERRRGRGRPRRNGRGRHGRGLPRADGQGRRARWADRHERTVDNGRRGAEVPERNRRALPRNERHDERLRQQLRIAHRQGCCAVEHHVRLRLGDHARRHRRRLGSDVHEHR